MDKPQDERRSSSLSNFDSPSRGEQRGEYPLKILTGNAHPTLAHEIAAYLRTNVSRAVVGKFSDGESRVQIEDNVRGADVFVIQPTCPPVNDNLMELLIILDALKRSSAARITAVIPYYGYARQDRKAAPRVPISAKLVADLLTMAGAHRVLAMELHAGQIQGFFSIPLDHVFAGNILVEYLLTKSLVNPVIVSPDAGGMERARILAKKLNANVAVIDKRRTGPNQATAMHLVGDVRGKDCIVFDDMIDTAGTIVEAIATLKRGHGNRIFACATHPVLSGPAIERLSKSEVEEIIVCNTIPIPPEKQIPNLTVLSIAPFLANAIVRIHTEESLVDMEQWPVFSFTKLCSSV